MMLITTCAMKTKKKAMKLKELSVLHGGIGQESGVSDGWRGGILSEREGGRLT